MKSGVSVYTGPTDAGFAREVAAYPGAESVLDCMQCGVCTGSCPMAGDMPEPPRKVMAHVLAGDRERALASESIWYCASCFSCAVRCPQGVSVADVMMALRSMAARETKNVSTAFYGAFTDSIAEGGRVHEAGVAVKTGLARGTGAMFRLAPMGMGLWRKGRMHLMKPEPIDGQSEVARLINAVRAHRPDAPQQPRPEGEAQV